MANKLLRKPWSYRNRMVFMLICCSLIAALISFALAFLVSRTNVRAETARAQREAAEAVKDLLEQTELDAPQIFHILDSASLTFEETEAAAIPAAVREALAEQAVTTEEKGLYASPVTWITAKGRFFRVGSGRSVNLMWTSILRVLFSIVLFLVCFSAASLYAADRMSRPVTELSQAMDQVAAGDFSVRLQEGGDDEIGRLKHAFNEMADSLSRNEYIQKDFIASISHEFKTPIASIRGYARLLKMPELGEDDRREYIRTIAREADRLSGMSQTLLRLTSLEQNQQVNPAHLVSYRLDEQLRQAVVELSPLWEVKSIEWEMELRPVTIRTDQALVSQVWTNILQNAIRFSDCGQSIRVVVYDAGEAVVEITDHGPGMSPETLKHAFDRFYQGDASRSGDGAGLGLTLAKRITDILGGTIRAESEPGKGSTFLVRLPLDPKDKEESRRG